MILLEKWKALWITMSDHDIHLYLAINVFVPFHVFAFAWKNKLNGRSSDTVARRVKREMKNISRKHRGKEKGFLIVATYEKRIACNNLYEEIWFEAEPWTLHNNAYSAADGSEFQATLLDMATITHPGSVVNIARRTCPGLLRTRAPVSTDPSPSSMAASTLCLNWSETGASMRV